MKQDLALQSVLKHRAKKTHLTVPATADTDIRTLCGVAMAAGEYDLIEGAADCRPCLRKKDNRAFISSAYFAQDAGTRLLEMSLQQARRSRAGRRAQRRQPVRLTVVPNDSEVAAEPTSERAPKGPGKPDTGARSKKGGRRIASTTPATPADADALSEDEGRALGLAALKRVGLDVYQSPVGVLVRLHRERAGWRIAEVTFDGPSSLTARASGRNSFVVGDVRLEEHDGTLRLKLTSARRA